MRAAVGYFMGSMTKVVKKPWAAEEKWGIVEGIRVDVEGEALTGTGEAIQQEQRVTKLLVVGKWSSSV